MSKKRYINDNIREDNYVMDLDPSEKLLFIYLLTNNKVSLCGIYELHIRKIEMETGFDKELILRIFNRFEKSDKIYYRDGYIFISNFVKNQSMNDNMKKGLKRELETLGGEKVGKFSSLKGFERLSKALESFGILNFTLLNLTLLNTNVEEEVKKISIGKFVKMTKEEYNKLCDKRGRKDVDDKIEDVNIYCGKSGKKYKDYYAATMGFLKRDLNGSKPKATQYKNLLLDDD